MDQNGCSDIAQQVCGFFCHCLVEMMDDLVTGAFLISVCIMLCVFGCVMTVPGVCVYARVNHLCFRVFWKDPAKLALQMIHGKLSNSLRLLIPDFFLLLNTKEKVFFFPYFYLYIKKLGVWRAPWAESYTSSLSMLFYSIWITR